MTHESNWLQMRRLVIVIVTAVLPVLAACIHAKELPKGIYALQVAASKGNLEHVKTLIDNGANVNFRDRIRGTAIQSACANGHEEVVAYLLVKGAKADETCLSSAAINGHADVVKLMLDQGIKPAAVKPQGDGSTLLTRVIDNNHVAVVRMLVDNGIDVNQLAGQKGMPLERAIEAGRVEIVDILLAGGAAYRPVEDKAKSIFNDRDVPALHMAIAANQVEVVRKLLADGADAAAHDRSSRGAVEQAVFFNRANMVKLLARSGANLNGSSASLSPLMLAVSLDNADMIDTLLLAGADINHVGTQRQTALQYAVATGHPDMARALLKRRAQVVTADSDAWLRAVTSLPHYHESKSQDERRERQREMITILAPHIDIKKVSRTGLAYAVEQDDIAMLELLLSLKFSPNDPTKVEQLPLYIAVTRDKQAMFERLLKAGADPNRKARDGHVVLTHAIKAKRSKMIEMLLAAGADVRYDTVDGTPLQMAARTGDAATVRLLLKRGVPVDDTGAGRGYDTPLAHAAASGSVETVRALLDAGAKADGAAGQLVTEDVVEVRNARGNQPSFRTVQRKVPQYYPPIVLAAQQHDLESVQLLLDHKADPNLRLTSQDLSALEVAAHSGIFEMVKILVESGARIQDCRVSPLNGLIRNRHADGLKWLLENGADPNGTERQDLPPILEALKVGDAKLVSILLDAGANPEVSQQQSPSAMTLGLNSHIPEVRDVFFEYAQAKGMSVNQQSSTGETPLHVAAVGHDPENVRRLLKAGADVNAVNKDGATALHSAAEWGKPEVVAVLLEHGAKINSQTMYGYTPLHAAVFRQRDDVVRILVEKGADVNANQRDPNRFSDRNGHTPLYLASLDDHLAIATLLIEKGAKVNVTTREGSTPLTRAAEHGSVKMVALLLKHGADVHATETARQKSNALAFAVSRGHVELTTLLLEHAARVNETSIDGASPLLVAVRQENVELVTLLLQHGADPTARDGRGRTPMTEAEHGRSRAIADLLRKATLKHENEAAKDTSSPGS